MKIGWPGTSGSGGSVSCSTPTRMRGAQEPDLGPDIRRWFGEAGFTEVACDEWIEGTGMRVGVEQLTEPPEPLVPGQPIFTFYR